MSCGGTSPCAATNASRSPPWSPLIFASCRGERRTKSVQRLQSHYGHATTSWSRSKLGTTLRLQSKRDLRFHARKLLSKTTCALAISKTLASKSSLPRSRRGQSRNAARDFLLRASSVTSETPLSMLTGATKLISPGSTVGFSKTREIKEVLCAVSRYHSTISIFGRP